MYRKLSADILFNGHEILPSETVLVLNPDGSVANLIPSSEAGEGIEVFEGMLTPGFVNCHCHLELSHMKGSLPRNKGLVPFLEGVMQQRQAEEPEILEAIAAAETEMYATGIVAVGDICNTTHTIAGKSTSKLHYHNFIEVAGFPEYVAEKRFLVAKELYEQFAVLGNNRSIVPHAPYSVSKSLLEKIVSFPDNEIMTMHNQESADEQRWFEDKSGGFAGFYEKLGIAVDGFTAPGTSGFRSFLPHFRLNRPLILVHNLHTSQADISYAQTMYDREDAPLYFCLCPHANEYISGQCPDPNLFMSNGMKIVLGTDSLASNTQLNIWEEIQLLRKMHPDIALAEMLRWATSNGARALMIDEKFGSFETGKKPGVVHIDKQDRARRIG